MKQARVAPAIGGIVRFSDKVVANQKPMWLGNWPRWIFREAPPRKDLKSGIESGEVLPLKGYSPFFCHAPAMTVAELETWEKDLVDARSEQSRRRRWAMAALVEPEDDLLAAVQYPDGKRMLEDWMDVAEEHHLACIEMAGYAYRAHQRLKALYDELFLAPAFKRKYKPKPKLDARGLPVPEPDVENAKPKRQRKARPASGAKA
ncbi:hypothetical protein [Dokdonella koreensis]|nr:hypothetical protein [Dokdonella koreensis]